MLPHRLSITKGDITMLLNRTLKMVLRLVVGITTIAGGLTRAVPVAGQATPDAQSQIGSATAAGPSSITEHATIMGNEMDAEGNPVVLREGSNDWTCFPDAPGPRIGIPCASTRPLWAG